MRRELCIVIVVIVFALTGVAVAQEETLATSSSKMLFILGTDENEGALLSAKNNSTLTGVMDIDVYTQNDTIPAINFSQYCVVVIENRTSADIAAWSAGLDAAKANGTHIIGYMLPHDVSITSVNQTIYTTFERYWIQGGQDNINNLIMYLGKQLCGKWASTTIPEPQVVRQRVSITYILNSDACNYYLNRVLSSNRVITDRFNVHVYSGSEAVSGLHDISHEDVIFLYMIGANEMTQLKDALLAAKANGTQIGLFGMMDTYGVATLDLTTPPPQHRARLLQQHQRGKHGGLDKVCWLRNSWGIHSVSPASPSINPLLWHIPSRCVPEDICEQH